MKIFVSSDKVLKIDSRHQIHVDNPRQLLLLKITKDGTVDDLLSGFVLVYKYYFIFIKSNYDPYLAPLNENTRRLVI